MNRKIIFFLPLALLLGVCVLLLAGLHQDPKKIASALIDKPVPEFYQALSFIRQICWIIVKRSVQKIFRNAHF